MMDRLREGAHNSIAVKAILGTIILSFVLAGISGYLMGGGSNAVAKVGKTEISRVQLDQAYQNQRNSMQQQYGDYFSTLLSNADYVKSLRRSVLDRLINNILLEQYAESLNLKVSDAQINSMILSMSEFQVNGKFDKDKYQATLRRAGYSADGFARELRQDALRNQIVAALDGGEFVLKGEIEAQNRLISQLRTIRTIPFSLTQFIKNTKLSDEEIKTYYEKNSATFTRPEQMKVAYLELSAEKLKAGVKVTDKEAEQYYQENLDKYLTKPQREVSHILIEGDNKAKAQAILDELKSGADFAKLAQEKSEDIGSAKEGGSLGWIERGVMDPAFEKAAFALKDIGEISGLVKSNFGWHIIKLNAVKAEQTKPYTEVATEIHQELAQQKAVDEFYRLQEKLEKVAYEFPDTLDDAAKAIAQPIQTTDFISLKNAPELLRNAEVLDALKTPEVKENGLNSGAIEVAPEHVIVVRIQESRPSLVLPLKEVKADVIDALSKTKAEQEMLALAQTVVERLKTGDQSVLTENKLSFGKEQVINRGDPLARAVFAMPKPEKGKVSYIHTSDNNGELMVVELSKVSEEANPEYATQISQQIAQSNTDLDINVILASLREKTDITYYSED